MFHPAVIAKTSWYKNNRYNENYFRSQDFELWCRTFENTNFSRIHEPLFIYREGKVNVKNYSASARAFRDILRTHNQGLLNKPELYWEITKSYFKSYLYRTFAFFDLHNTLSSTRNEKLNTAQKSKVKEVIERIKSWPQSGI
ncbi:MAG: hypothetical protein IPP72_04730 [Chitinophagaceae bacterium]|nr:hypothetical protein [Chitinophagaceae bacterium]